MADNARAGKLLRGAVGVTITTTVAALVVSNAATSVEGVKCASPCHLGAPLQFSAPDLVMVGVLFVLALPLLYRSAGGVSR